MLTLPANLKRLADRYGIPDSLPPVEFCRRCVAALKAEQEQTAEVQKSVTAEFMQAARRVVDYHTKPLPTITRDEVLPEFEEASPDDCRAFANLFPQFGD